MNIRSHLAFFILCIFIQNTAVAGEFSLFKQVAAMDSMAPHLAVASDGTVVMNWLEPDGDGHTLRFSVLTNNQWETARTVASGGNWFVNWADFPSVVPISNQFWVAHWLVSQPAGGYAYDVAVSVSNDAGRSWSEPFLSHDDQTATEHGFVSFFPDENGAGMIWLDGRNMTGEAHSHEAEGNGEGMTLRSAFVTPNAEVVQPRLVDSLVCDCCQTDVVLSDAGPVAVYRNRTEEEIRDIYYARLINGQWTPGRPVSDDHWNISGCPVNGPAIAARGNNLVVAWYTGANEEPAVQVAFSNEFSSGFGPAIKVDVANPLGGVDVLLLDNGDSVVSWLGETAEGKAVFQLQRISPSGIKGQQHQIAVTSAGRMTGFPQMVSAAGKIILAWTDRYDQKTIIKSAWIPLSSM
ncbi:MAG: glycoside hydrolase [Gammaproteobacteria bacterium]|nr:glycoside hydrolase [Gammaproteobacteria bacterium]